MLDERKTAILSAVVQEYIASALPVGSTHIAGAPGVARLVGHRPQRDGRARAGGLPRSSPTRRQVACPTDKGYRFFVDHLATPGRLDAVTREEVGAFFRNAHGRLEEMLHRTSDLLAHLTNYVSVVVAPRTSAVAVRSVQIVRLSTTMATVVVVLGNGRCRERDVRARRRGARRPCRRGVVPPRRRARRPLARRPCASGARPAATPSSTASAPTPSPAVRGRSGDEHAYVGGTSTMASAFDAVEIVRDVLRTLEQQFVVVTLVSDLIDRGVSVAIGVEHGVEPLAACSVVVAPVVVEGEHLGSVGVLGPTRMNYPQALATVEVVSDQLGRHLQDG